MKAGLVEDTKEIALKKNRKLSLGEKAIIYALLEERDSMYYYLHQNLMESYLVRVPSVDQHVAPHSSHAFDPYRNEPRYREFMENYFLE